MQLTSSSSMAFSDPLVPPKVAASHSDYPPQVAAMLKFDAAVRSRIALACKGEPHGRDVKAESVRVWIDKGVVTRALMLDPEAEASLKECFEATARRERDLPASYGPVHEWTVFLSLTSL
jgi:hypothetical protein